MSSRGSALVDDQLAQAIAGPVSQLVQVLTTLPAPAERLWRHLLPLSAGIENNGELAEVVLRKACGSATAIAHGRRLAHAIADVERAFRERHPSIADELVLRGKPLREQWEARGPGMLRMLAELTDPELLVDRADVVLVHPISGGGGEAYLSYNSVQIEALLANATADLPEVARLAWLLAQLHLDLPRFSECVSPGRLPEVAALALIPAALRAAEYVELTHYEESNIQRAVQAWVGERPGDTPLILIDWWNTYEESRPKFPLAIQALEKMLAQ